MSARALVALALIGCVGRAELATQDAAVDVVEPVDAARPDAAVRCDMTGSWRVHMVYADACREEDDYAEWVVSVFGTIERPDGGDLLGVIYYVEFTGLHWLPATCSVVLDDVGCSIRFTGTTLEGRTTVLTVHRTDRWLLGEGTIASPTCASVLALAGEVYPTASWLPDAGP